MSNEDKIYFKLNDGETLVSVSNINFIEDEREDGANLSYELDLIENPNNVKMDDVSEEINSFIIKALEESLKEIDDD